MKILLSNAVVSHGAFHHWMTADLRALGHEVETIDPDELCEQFGIELYRRVLLQRIAAERPDVFVCYPPYDLLREAEARAIHAHGTLIAGFAYDDPIFLPSFLRKPGDFERICEEYRRTYDIYLTTSRQMVKEARQRGIDFIEHIRWACVTPPDPATLNVRRDVPLVLIGAPYPRRVRMVRYLKDAGLRPAVFGADGWKQFLDVADCYQGMLTRPGMFEMYRRARVALAPADWESTYTPMVKLRSLEISSCGPLQVIEQCEDLRDYYQDGTEIVSYGAERWDELVGAIRAHLDNEPRRAAIARAGYERTVRDHVWAVRWKEIEDRALPLLERLRAGTSVATSPPDADVHLAQELGLAACAMHYEKLADLPTANNAVDEWLAVRRTYANLLAKARLCYHARRYEEAEQTFLDALAAARGLCNLGVDVTVTQRKLGPRLGLGRMFAGIFPRHLECYAHLLIIYAATHQADKAEDLMSRLAANHDHLFVALVAVIAEPGVEDLVPPQHMARYVEVMLTLEPQVWAGEKQRHRAHFWMLRGQSLAAMGQMDEARQCLKYALTQDPYPQVEQQIRKVMALVG